MGRTGSTLLRFLLDAHPELACPPETSMPALCGQLSVVWSLIEGAPLAAERDAAPPRVPKPAVAGIRRMLDEMTGSYLGRRGKKVFCDKSLGSARVVGLLTQIYPGAKFLCVYRHPMDVIASGLDACPWGLNGYGFDQYIVNSPGNSVLALARYWLDNATLIHEAEKEWPEHCHRIRYEDLVEDPETVMAKTYEFIGVAPAPGVAQACFSGDRERFGPADYKIWATSRISGDSIGKGESVPAGLIAPPVKEAINELTAELGYLPVDDEWGTPGRAADPRLPESIPGQTAPVSVGPAPESEALEECLRTRLKESGQHPSRQWESCAAEKFLIVSRAATGGGGETQWIVDAATRSITVELERMMRPTATSRMKAMSPGPSSVLRRPGGRCWTVASTCKPRCATTTFATAHWVPRVRWSARPGSRCSATCSTWARGRRPTRTGPSRKRSRHDHRHQRHCTPVS
jgi:hypothetical protein